MTKGKHSTQRRQDAKEDGMVFLNLFVFKNIAESWCLSVLALDSGFEVVYA
jgi:hypothetical protein